MSENKRNRSMFGKGYYIALILCAAAIGITGYMYYRNTEENSAQLLETEPDTAIVATEGQKDVPVIATQPRQEDEQVFAYTRSHEGKTLLVACNFSGENAALDEAARTRGDVLIANYKDAGDCALLRPWECRVTLV